MKSILKIFGIVALTAIIGFSMVACDVDSNDNGTLTISNDTSVDAMITIRRENSTGDIIRSNVPIRVESRYRVDLPPDNYYVVFNGLNYMNVNISANSTPTIRLSQFSPITGTPPAVTTGILTIRNSAVYSIAKVTIYSGNSASGTPLQTDTIPIAVGAERSYTLNAGAYFIVAEDTIAYEADTRVTITAGGAVIRTWDSDFD